MTTRRASILAILPCLLWLPNAWGVRYAIDRFQHLDGVIVRGTLQDSQGFLWLATDNGLWRWDGSEFRRLTETVAFSGPVHCLVEDRHGTLLAATQNGVHGIDVTTLLPHSDSPWLPGQSTRQLAIDGSGDLWVGGFPGLFRLTQTANTYLLPPDGAPLAGSEELNAYSLRRSDDGTMWLGTHSGLYRIHNGQFTSMYNDDINAGRITAITFTSDGAIWIGTRLPGRLYRIEGDSIRSYTAEDGLANTDANVIVEHPNSEVWVGTERGVYRWGGDRFTAIDRGHGLVNDDIHSLYVDREKQVWIGTFGGGAYRLRSAQIITYGMEDGLPHSAITSMTRGADGSLLVGTVNGVARFDPATGRATLVRQGCHALAVYTDSEGTSWISDDSGVGHLSDNVTSPPAHGKCLSEDESGRVVVGAGSSVVPLDAADRRPSITIMPYAEILAICPSHDGALLLGTDRSLVRVRDSVQEVLLDGFAVTAIMYDARGRLILGTAQGLGWLNHGVLELFEHRSQNRFTTYDLLLDHRGTIWAATNVGVLRLERGIVERFGRSDGLPSEDVRVIMESEPGILYAGTTQGLARLEAGKLETCQLPPTVLISQLMAGGHTVAFREPNLQFSHAEHDVTIWTQRLGWRSAEGARSQFRLIGGNGDWSEPSGATHRFYPDLPPGDYTLFTRAVNEHGLTGEPVGVSFRILSPFWQTTWFLASVATALLGVIALVGKLYARRRQLRQAAAAAVRARSEFVSRMSHEIRTPLTVILACAETLSDDRLPRLTQADCIDTVLRNGRHLLGVVNDVLDLSRINSDEIEIELIPCELSELLSEVESIAKHKAADKPIDIRVRIDDNVPVCVVTDPTRLRQILINLLDNAIKFTDEGFVKLRVTWRSDPSEPGGTIGFIVLDTGHGITPEKQAVVFGAFRQEDSSITRRYGGTGLGLTIAKSLTDLLGGTLTLNTELGAGTAFSLELPAQVAERSTQQSETTAGPRDRFGINLDGARVLVADDCDDLRRVTEIILHQAGAHPVCVADGESAVQRACQETFDVILLDIHMPQLDGVSALKELRRRGVRAPFLAISADATEETRRRCRRAGFNGFIAKPFDRDTLLTNLRRVVDPAGAGGHDESSLIPASTTRSVTPNDRGDPIHSELVDQSPRLAEAVAEFVDALEHDIDRLDEALARDDAETVLDITHRLKGAGGINGYMCVSQAADRIGRCVAQAELPEASEQVQGLRSLHRRMRAGFAHVSEE